MSVEDDYSPKQFSLQDMHFAHSERQSQAETEEEHDRVMSFMGKYLALVPVGQAKERSRRLNPKFRAELFMQRGCACEACNRDLTQDKYEVHHTNYNKGDDPDYLKILCRPCHGIVNVLTGVKTWFATESGLKPRQKFLSEEGIQRLLRMVELRDEIRKSSEEFKAPPEGKS